MQPLGARQPIPEQFRAGRNSGILDAAKELRAKKLAKLNAFRALATSSRKTDV